MVHKIMVPAGWFASLATLPLDDAVKVIAETLIGDPSEDTLELFHGFARMLREKVVRRAVEESLGQEYDEKLLDILTIVALAIYILLLNMEVKPPRRVVEALEEYGAKVVYTGLTVIGGGIFYVIYVEGCKTTEEWRRVARGVKKTLIEGGYTQLAGSTMIVCLDVH